MVYLIGVDHTIQHGGYLNDTKREALRGFVSYLQQVVAMYRIEVIAEEFSEWAVRTNQDSFSTCQEVARLAGIEHRFCDPDPGERLALRIGDEDHDARERLWVERIHDLQGRQVVFVCGKDHLAGFSEKLEGAGFRVSILSQGWGVGLFRKFTVEYMSEPRP